MVVGGVCAVRRVDARVRTREDGCVDVDEKFEIVVEMCGRGMEWIVIVDCGLCVRVGRGVEDV